MIAPATLPAGDAATIELSVLAGRLQTAVQQDDIVQTLVTTAALDRMIRCLGPHQQAAADHARGIVLQAIETLQEAVHRGRQADLQSRSSRASQVGAAYATAAAAR